MKKSALLNTILQWVVPIALLLASIVVFMIRFAIDSEKNITELCETNNKQVGKSYSENVESCLSTIASVSDIMHQMVETRGGYNVTYMMDTVDVMASYSDAYMTVYCWTDGDAVMPKRKLVDLRETSYYQLLKGEENFFTYTEDDGITGKAAFLYVCPVEWDGEINGYLITYIDPLLLTELFTETDYGEDAYYAIVDQVGNVLASYGNTEGTTLLQSNFWNSLRDIAEGIGQWAAFDRLRTIGAAGALKVQSEEESRTLYSYSIGGTDWSLVVFLNDYYISQSLDSMAEPGIDLIVWISVTISAFVVVIITINIVFRLKTREQNEKLKNEADTDLLTGLTNKIATERKIKEYMRNNPKKQCLMFVMDVDNFKKINDTRGHAFGDEVLRELGMRLYSMFRVTDIIGRVGGDEFIIFLKDIKDVETAEREGKKLEQFFKQFEVGEYVKYTVTASIGGAVFPGEGKNFEELYKAADKALYVSKKQGKNRLTFYHQTQK